MVSRQKPGSMAALLILVGLGAGWAAAQTARWPEAKAQAWYAQQPWLVGSNYVPASAINQLEMWQEAIFAPRRDRPRAGLGRGDRHEHDARRTSSPSTTTRGRSPSSARSPG